MTLDILIIGGGLAGLINSILLSRSGLKVAVVEKRKFPFHKVCGEYISNETLPFLEKHDLYPTAYSPARMDWLQITSTSGKSFQTDLDLGGFGISRFTYDHWLAQKARASGVNVMEETTVTAVGFAGDSFTVETNKGEVQLQAKVVIGAYGKRDKLDKTLQRSFINNRYPYVGIKYHVKMNAARDTIALHNFKGGYCGVCSIEDDKFNICYLTHRDVLKKYGSIDELEKKELSKNPWLADVFRSSEFLHDKPEVINEISFEKKEAVYDHILMSGDSAGMITPLCGNGMAMAIHSAKLLSETILEHWREGVPDRARMERDYTQRWDALFARRLWLGRQLQTSLFGNSLASEVAVFTGRYLRSVSRSLVKLTHGSPFS